MAEGAIITFVVLAAEEAQSTKEGVIANLVVALEEAQSMAEVAEQIESSGGKCGDFLPGVGVADWDGILSHWTHLWVFGNCPCHLSHERSDWKSN